MGLSIGALNSEKLPAIENVQTVVFPLTASGRHSQLPQYYAMVFPLIAILYSGCIVTKYPNKSRETKT